jgi:hypothetical protein
MAGKKESYAPWRQISIVIRADLLERARQQKIDVSEACNRALAERLGIDYRQQKIPDRIVLEPVIIAANGKPVLPDPVSPEPGVLAVPAIINADDPHAAKVLKSRHTPKGKPVRDVLAPASLPAPAAEQEIKPQRASSLTTGKAKKPAPRKKKDDAAKKFFTSMILREDTEAAIVAKDDMYYTFERWCRDHRVLPIPDKKSFSVTLKNQFAVKEKIVDGKPVWVGIRLK